MNNDNVLNFTNLGVPHVSLWRAELYDESPFVHRQNGTIKCAPYVHAMNDKKGLYLWLYRTPQGKHRFVHVGMSTVSLGRRTSVHCRNQFLCDRVHSIDFAKEPRFGNLGPNMREVCRAGDAGDECQLENDARVFLEMVSILYLIPSPCVSESATVIAIKKLEGTIARSAAYLLGANEITNTIGRTARTEHDIGKLAPAVASEIKQACDCLPRQRMVST